MKRSTPMRRTPLKSRGAPLARRAPINQKSSRPKTKPATVLQLAEGIGEAIARERVRGRSGGWCEIQLVGCLGRATDWHHRKNRSQQGLWQASNGLHACRWCHEAVTNTRGRRAEFERNGWIVPSHEVPAAVPVLLPTGQHVLLNDEGQYIHKEAA